MINTIAIAFCSILYNNNYSSIFIRRPENGIVFILKQFFKFVLPNLLRKHPTQKQIERNTNAYIKAMDKHRVSILAHLGYAGCAVDPVRLAKEAAKRNIYIELNGKRINFSKEMTN